MNLKINEGKEICEMSPLSKSVKNKLAEIFKQFYDIKKVKQFLNEIALPNYDIHSQGRVNLGLPEIFAALINKENGVVSFEFSEIREAIEVFAEKLANNESMDDVVFSIGMGGSLSNPNVRTPAYIISAIKILSSFNSLAERGIISSSPKVRVFKADNLSSLLNNFELEEVKKTTAQTFDFLSAFLEEFFPDLKKQFNFVSDAVVNVELLEELEKQSHLLNEIESIRESLENILKMGEKHGQEKGKSNALIYAAAHPFFNKSISPKGEKKSSLIIDLGGRPQERFNDISRGLIEKNKGSDIYITTPTLHFIVKAGKIPVYYTARQGDLPLNSEFSGINLKELDRVTHQDYSQIFSLVPQEDFEEFVKAFIIKSKF